MRKLLPAFIVTLLASTCALVSGCGDSGDPNTPTPTTPATNKIQLAMVLSLSGPAKAIGDEAKRGAEVAVAQLNSLGGVLNKQIELLVENDSSDPAITLQKVNEFVAKKVYLGIGPSTSTTALAIKDLILNDQIVYVSPSATSSTLDELYGVTNNSNNTPELALDAPNGLLVPPKPVFFRTAATDIYLSAALAQFGSGASTGEASRRCSSIVLVQQNDTYGIPIGDALQSYYRSFSLAVKQTITLDPNGDDTQKLSDAAAAAASTDAQCQVVVAQPEVAGGYMRAFRAYRDAAVNAHKRDASGGWNAFLTIGSDGFHQEDFIVAGRVNQADSTAPTAGEGSFAIAADTAPELSQAYSAFRNLFKARFPTDEPGRYGSTAYDAVILMAAAIERAGDVSVMKPIRDNLYKMSIGQTPVRPNKLSDMFDTIRRGESINYEGASGSIDFSKEGHVVSNFGAWKIMNAQFVPVETITTSSLSGLSGVK